MPSLWQRVRNHFLPNQGQGNNNNYVQMVPINAQAAQLWQRVRNHFFPNQGQGNNNNNVELMPINPQAAPEEDLEQGVINQAGAVDPDPHHHGNNGQPPAGCCRKVCDFVLKVTFGMTTNAMSWVSTSMAAGGLLMLPVSTLGMDWDERFRVHTLVHIVAPIFGSITLFMVILARCTGPSPRLDVAVASLGIVCAYLLYGIWQSVIPNFNDMMRMLDPLVAQAPAPLGC